MDLDALSGIIVYKHTGQGVTTVTAALDRITIAHPLTEICDLEYSGQVTYAVRQFSELSFTLPVCLESMSRQRQSEKLPKEPALPPSNI